MACCDDSPFGQQDRKTLSVSVKTQYYTATSLDGFIATEDDSLDWLFALGDLSDSSYPAFISEVGALAMGSATYEWMIRHADKVAQEVGSPWPYSQPTWVFTSRDLPTIEGANIRFATGDVRQAHDEMRSAAGAKNIWIVGGGDLAGQFHDAGLLDELILQVGSVTLGKGKPLFPRRVLSPTLQLISCHQMGASMVELRYEVRKQMTS
jgi:dihydrofolate reductase